MGEGAEMELEEWVTVGSGYPAHMLVVPEQVTSQHNLILCPGQLNLSPGRAWSTQQTTGGAASPACLWVKMASWGMWFTWRNSRDRVRPAGIVIHIQVFVLQSKYKSFACVPGTRPTPTRQCLGASGSGWWTLAVTGSGTIATRT